MPNPSLYKEMSENEWVTGRVTLRIGNAPLDLEMTVPARPVKPHRMLPIFHQMANTFADMGVQAAESEGRSISCKAGCGACCRQPVPVSEIELYQLAELVNEMPEPRRTAVKKRFEAACEHFDKLGWFEIFRSAYLKPKTSIGEVESAIRVLHDYFEEGIACPFLEDESCSIHADRPVSCREYLVTSSPSNCASLDGKNIEMVDLPVKPSKTLKKIAETEDAGRSGQLLLIEALRYTAAHAEQFEEKTGEQWMADFFGRLVNDKNAVPEPPEHVPNPRKRRSRHGSKR